MGRVLVAIFVVLVMLKLMVVVARADHNILLPGLPTPLINSIKATQTVKWCANDAAHNYPNFVAQIEDVQREYTSRVGIKFEKVSFGTMASTGCQVQHNVQEFSCQGCAAHIYYANWPVVIEYKPSLGYSDWRSAIGHELGHGLLGLHERYRDSSGTIGCGGPDKGFTVMDCGEPYIKYPTTLDVNRGCPVLGTTWCGVKPEQEYPYWTGTCWNYGYWCYDPAQNTWVDPQGVSEWQPWVNGQVFNRRTGDFYWEYSSWYHWNGTRWECLERCM